MKFVATCLFGLERLLAEDIESLGYERVDTIDGRVTYSAPDAKTAECIARSNINFRYAERVFIKLGSFRALSFEDLYQGVKNLPWEKYIGKHDAFPVKGHSIRSKLYSIPDCQKIIKKAVVDRLSDKYGLKQFPESQILYRIEFFIFNDQAYLMIDTTGDSLHKRGYRPHGNIAPLRETLAASMVKLSRPRENVAIVDPLCGSGTIAIEAALYVSNTAPGLHRSFAAEDYPFVAAKIWEAAREEARQAITSPQTPIYAFDIDPKSIDLAIENAKRAGVDSYIKFEVADVNEFSSPTEVSRGTIITNPPYGERMGDITQARELLGQMGKVFADTVPAWQMYILSSDPQFSHFFGRRSDKVKPMYNGRIKCGLHQYFKTQKN